MSNFVISELKGDRHRLLELLDATRAAFEKEVAARDLKIDELHKKLIASFDRIDPLTLKIERLETAAKRRKAR